MGWYSLVLIACIVSCITQLSVQALPANVAASGSTELSKEQLSQLAKSITVKVLSGETWGSGILIQRQGQVYTVLTNDHVLTPGYGKPYRIQTPEGRVYPAVVLKSAGFDGNDLGLLQFRSNTIYTVASLGTASTLASGNDVFAAGFPFGAKGFVFTAGRISLLLEKALEGGYQIGYTNDIQKGMSGGPLLNQLGKVVGINGRHAYPLWGNGYMFKDGSTPPELLQQQIIQLSWAVPIQTFVKPTGVRSFAPVLTPLPTIIQPKQPDTLLPNGWLW